MTTETIKYLDVISKFMNEKNSKFISIIYTDKDKQTTKQLVHFNVNYKKVCEKDLIKLSKYVCQNEIELIAKDEMMKSLNDTINDCNELYTKKEYYTYISKNVKHNNKDTVYFNCFSFKREVIVEVKKKSVKHSDKTNAKNHIRKVCNLKQNKFREFKINFENLHQIKMNNETITMN